ncbi:GDSL-type esterase/lipase family protein [Paenibacillus ferrarius]|uniref:GDSL-type esterase/lipase family protein n=1 Tax=Paenibacillus ferrarius TaxID=1469647 RepID=UPI003D2D6A22
MKSSRFIWGAVGITASLSTLLFAAGFVYAANQIWFPKASSDFQLATPAPKKESMIESASKLQIVALGDSLTAGTGDNTGQGYVGRVREKLEKDTGKPVFVLNNLAVPGYKTDQLLTLLTQQKTKDALSQANLILLTIGGNDIFQGGEGLFSDENQTEFNPAAAASRVAPALKKVEQILAAIGQANPKATVLYLGLYHPFLDLDPSREGSVIVQRWNDGIFQLVNKYPNMLVVPTYDLFEQNLIKYLSSADHFHPNGDGYERIADRIEQILR